MGIGSGSSQSARLKEQTALGTYSATGGQVLNRVSGGISFERTKIENPQIRADKMGAMPRGGLGMTSFTYDDIVTPGGHSLLYQAITLGTYATAPTSGALTNVTAAVTATPVGTFTRAAGDYLAAGFRRGQVVRWTGWTAPATANNARNFVILDITATVMTCLAMDGQPVVAKTAGDSVTCALVGKQVQTPITGHVDRYFIWEDWHPDVPASERSFDTRVETCNFSFQGNANATVQFGFKGLVFDPDSATAYFSSPTAAVSTPIAGTATGVITQGGVRVGLMTAATVNITATLDMPTVIGAATYPFAGATKIMVTGDIGVLWDSQTLTSAYLAETDLDLHFAFASGKQANAEFVAISLPRMRLFSAGKSNGIESIVKTYTIEAAENGAAAAGRVNSVIAIQDSLAT